MKGHLFTIAATALALMSCDSGGSSGSANNPPGCGEPGSNVFVMSGLKPTCEKCHGAGSNRPFFSSLQAFEDLLAYNPAYVVPGDPGASELIHLLKGESTGPFKQMPTAGAAFFALEADGKTSIGLADIEAWISDLPERSTPSYDHLKAATIRRIDAEHALVALNTALGLTDPDLFNADYTGLNDPDALPARSSDAFNVVNDYTFDQAQVYPRFETLGGPSWLQGKPRDTSFSPVFLQAIIQMAQARCRAAVEKPGNTAILRLVTLADTSTAAEAKIKDNLRYLHLRFLGETATDGDTADLYQLYLAYEPKDTTTAWTAVCSGLVRHPLFLSY
jgi:hypothetical protein